MFQNAIRRRPWVGMLKDDIWIRHASHANAMAALMHDLLTAIPGTNPVSSRGKRRVRGISKPAIQALYAKGWLFYNFIGEGGCRPACSGTPPRKTSGHSRTSRPSWRTTPE